MTKENFNEVDDVSSGYQSDVEEEFMLSTSDNPYDPYDDFVKWYLWDVAAGYNTCAYLARICEYSGDISDSEEALSINDAIEEALMLNLTGNRIKVARKKENVFV